jgi:Rrf2 family protein
MRLSTKGRYALAAAVSLAQHHGAGEAVTAVSISETLGISKIYLEQVFSLLKRAGLVVSFKGAQGGYLLARMPDQITVFELLSSVEAALFDTTEDTVAAKAPELEAAMRDGVFKRLDAAVKDVLAEITLEELVSETQRRSLESAQMYYI